jgi:hemerythrin-like domain-containing protein
LIWIKAAPCVSAESEWQIQDPIAFPMSTPISTPPPEQHIFAHNPLDVIAHAHAVQVQMCDAMERIADGLPDDVDRRLCAQVASCLQFDLPLHHQDEETALFPILRMRALPEDGLEVILDRLASEHTSDTDFASEIAEALELLVNGDRIGNANTVGYMLRGFFERYRRHVHWENTLIMPVARLRLTPEDLALIAVRMDANRSKAS